MHKDDEISGMSLTLKEAPEIIVRGKLKADIGVETLGNINDQFEPTNSVELNWSKLI
ncbi:hypothetical protein [Acinetobacter sp. TSRC1-2]|uniref:hypothetical protein n=1 Tax=unclassified Acinetobacter TaxID=196816 RepID=UPI003CEFD8F0